MKTLNVGIFIDSPWVNENWQKSYKPGIYIELIGIFCKALKANCTLALSPTNEYGHYANFTWHGMVKYMLENMFDLSLPAFTPTLERQTVVDFSSLVLKVPVVLVTRNPQTRTISVLSFFSFQWSVWLCLICLSVYMGMFLTYVEVTKWKSKGTIPVAFTRCIDVFSLISYQGMTVALSRPSSRILVTFWLLAALILGGIYSARLLSKELSTNGVLPFRDFQTFIECVEMRKCSLAADSISRSFIQDIYKNEDDIALKKLRKALEQNPIAVVPDAETLFEMIASSFPTYLTTYTLHATFMKLADKNKLCRFSTISSGLYDEQAFMFAKNFSMIEGLNVNVSAINGMGIPMKIYDAYVGLEPDCFNKPLEGGNPLPMISFFGLLLLLGCGCIFGCTLLTCETFLFKWTAKLTTFES